MIRKFLPFALSALFALQAVAQEQGEGPLLDLEYVLRQALGTNEVIAQADEEVNKSRLLRRMAWTAIIPQSSFNASFIRNNKAQVIDFSIPGMDTPETGGFTITPLYDWNASLTISQPLYLGGRSFMTLKQSGINIGLSEDRLDTTTRETLFQVAAAYANVVKAQRNLEISRESLELSRRQLRQAEVLFRAGEAVRTSVLRAEAGVAAAELQAISSDNALAKAREDLAVLCGLRPPFKLKPIDVEPELPADDIEGLVHYGLAHRSELRAADRQMEIADLEVGKAFGEKLPSVFLNFNYTRQRAAFPASSFWKLILSVNVPVFDGGLSTVNRATAEASYRQALLQRQLLRKRIRAEITQAYLDYTSVRRALLSAQKQVDLTRRTYEDIERFFKVGEATDLDVQDARQRLIDAERELANLTTDEMLALFNLRKQLGLVVVEVK